MRLHVNLLVNFDGISNFLIIKHTISLIIKKSILSSSKKILLYNTMHIISCEYLKKFDTLLIVSIIS